MQFEMLVRINYWNGEEKSAYLAVCLRGYALAVLSNVPAEIMMILFQHWRQDLGMHTSQSSTKQS